MGYKLVARIHLQRDNGHRGAALLQKLGYEESEEFISTIYDRKFLQEVREYLELAPDTVVTHRLIMLINIRLAVLDFLDRNLAVSH